MRKISHFTTLIPFGLDDQLETLKTWHDAYQAPVYTVNHTREYNILKGALPDWVTPVEVRFAQRYGRDFIPLPVLRRAIQKVVAGEASRVVLANSDISLRQPEILSTLENPGCDLMFASRDDVNADGESVGTYDKGYDVFSFSLDAICCLDIPETFLGMPWWDYVVPLRTLMDGYSVKRLDTSAFPHRVHPQRWSIVAFNYIGWQFVRQLIPKEISGTRPTNDMVLEFAKFTNKFLNSDILVRCDEKQEDVRKVFLKSIQEEKVFHSKDFAEDKEDLKEGSIDRRGDYSISKLNKDCIRIIRKAVFKGEMTKRDAAASMADIEARIGVALPVIYRRVFDRYAAALACGVGDLDLGSVRKTE